MEFQRATGRVVNIFCLTSTLRLLKLKCQYFGHLMQTADTLEKFLMLGKIEVRRRGHQRMRWLDGIIDAVDVNLGKLPDVVRNWQAWHAAVHAVAKSRTQLGD